MIGKKLSDRYEVVRELGRGGMGIVYLANDLLLEREVAIKLLTPALITPELAERFKREARAIAKMDHPAIVSVHNIGQHEGALFFVMPFVPGTNLRAFLQDHSLSLGDLVDIGIQVAEALDYSHARGVVHRDIKPENIMISREGSQESVRVRVTDFGLAMTASENRLTQTGSLVGTISYLSPEQIEGGELDGRTDIYSLGTVLYECLVGDTPFSGEIHTVVYRIMRDHPQSPRSRGTDVDEELERIVMWCLEKDPGRRPQRAREVANVLMLYRSGLHQRESERASLSGPPRIRPERRVLSFFIGREREYAELQRRLNDALLGECQFVVVGGEAGVGKSRLLAETESLACERSIRVLHGRFLEQDKALPYQGFCEAIQEYFQSGASPNISSDFTDLATDLLTLFPTLSEIPEIRSTSSSATGISRVSESKKIGDRTYIFELLARSLTRIANGKPLVLLLEDLHLADVSLDALQYVVHRLGPTPTLIAGTYRTTEVDKRHPLVRMLDSFQGDRRFASIALKPFSLSEHRAFLEDLLGSTELSDVLADKLFEATEGNPYFTRELVRSLSDQKSIIQDDTGALTFSGDSEISSQALPATIQQTVEKRIERLPENLREILSIASVIGKTFEVRDLQVLVEKKEWIEDAVDLLVKEGFIEEERESRTDRLTFCSGMVRDVLYEQLLRRKRKSLHRKYAEYLEKRRYAGGLERVYPKLVHHYSLGDVPERVVEYGMKLARKALDTFSSEEAIRAARTVLDFLEEEGGNESIEGQARTLLAAAYRMSGNSEAALKELEGVVRIFERANQTSQVVKTIVLAAESAWAGRKVEETIRWIDKGLPPARAAGETESLARLLSLGATVANLRGEYEKAKAYQQEAERIQPPSWDSDEEMTAGGRLVVALPFSIGPMHPVTIKLDEEAEILANVFEQLVKMDAEGNLIPHLCERWEAQEEGRAFLLTIRQDVRMQDGRRLTSQEIKGSFERAIRLASGTMPPAFAAISGMKEYLDGSTDHVSGIVTVSAEKLVIQLQEVLPIYPALLTDMKTSIVQEKHGQGTFIGTGPFKITSFPSNSVVIERNPDYWKGGPPYLDAVEFRGGLSASEIASGFRSGVIDLAHDLLPQDLEEILRDRRLRAGLVEATKKNVFFILFNSSSPLGGVPEIRQALFGVLRTQDLVRSTLGRFAQPAEGLFPPGIQGHDPGRRRQPKSREKALELIQSTKLTPPLRLKASVHPILQDRYAPLTRALFKAWSDIGVEISIETPTMQAFLSCLEMNVGIDLMIGRWIAEYDDPDDFTYSLFHSKMGDRKNYYSSEQLDRLIEEARAQTRPAEREKLYRKIENLLIDGAYLLPLFHEIDYRVARPRVKRLTLRSTAPYVNYSEVKIAKPAPSPPVRRTGGMISIPFTGVLDSLDPTPGVLLLRGEVIPNIFETLTQTQSAQIVPWLASSFQAEQGGRRFRFRLRDDVRFHDGRRLSARDVRYSFERLLQNKEAENRWFLSSIRGATALLNGEVGYLEGFRILSPNEFVVDLEDPLSFFPAILSFHSTAIVPEGCDQFQAGWKEGCAGTGPFRVVRFEPDHRLELEPNPYYWRRGYPKCDGLTFSFGVLPSEIASEFRAGRFSLAWELLPSDMEVLRHDFHFAPGYRETPRLSTYYMAFNIYRGPLSDEKVRLQMAQSVDVEGLVRRAAGRLALPAHQFIPPGLLGYQPARRNSPRVSTKTPLVGNIELTTTLNSVYQGTYANFAKDLFATLRAGGFRIQVMESRSEYYANQAEALATADLALTRWIADYPDTDNFVGLLHSEKGLLGKLCGTPEVDALIERGRCETDPQARHQIYQDLEEFILQRALLLPLFHEQSYCFPSPGLEGCELNFFYPFVPYDKLWKR